MIQRTLVVLKPDTVKRGLIGEVTTRFERLGLHLVGMKMVQPDEQHYYKHYEEIGTMITRYNEEIFALNRDYMMTGPVIAMVWEGIEAIALVRKIAGSTEPKAAAPGTIRGDYAQMSYPFADANKSWFPNILHASSSEEEAHKEIALWFSPHELHEHELALHTHKRGVKPSKK